MSGSLGSTGSPVSTTATAPTKARNQTQVFVYDITLSAHLPNTDELVDPECLKRIFKIHCKKWTFQLEKGNETGYMHYQCRVSLKNKLRPDRARTMWSGYLPGCHITPTAGCNSNNVFYVSKEETRVQGPWSDNSEPAFIPVQYSNNNMKWLPWQQSVLDLLSAAPHFRNVNVIVDPIGTQGKSTFACWHACRGLAEYIPPLKDFKDICRIVCDVPMNRVYFVDMPRGLRQNDLNGLFAAIENMKVGMVFDDRNNYKRKWIHAPHIWVFMNECPNVFSMTLNRWVFWTIDSRTKELINVTNETLESIRNREVPYFGPRSLSLNIIEDPSLIPDGMPQEVRDTLEVIEEENSVESAPGLPHSVDNSVQPLPAQIPPHNLTNTFDKDIVKGIIADDIIATNEAPRTISLIIDDSASKNISSFSY